MRKYTFGYAVRMSKNRFTYYINKEKFISHEIAEDTSAEGVGKDENTQENAIRL